MKKNKKKNIKKNNIQKNKINKKSIIRYLLRIPFFILILVGVWFLVRYKIMIYLVGREVSTTEIAFQSVEVDKNTLQIKMQFKLDGEMNGKKLEQIKKTYKSLDFMIYEKNWMPYKDYGLAITFNSGEDTFFFQKPERASSETLIRNGSSISIVDIATQFPDVTTLYIEKVPYEKISDFDGFHNLKFLYYAFEMPYKDEKHLSDKFQGLQVTDLYTQTK